MITYIFPANTLLKIYLAIASVFAVQVIHLKLFAIADHDHARKILSPRKMAIYDCIYKILEHMKLFMQSIISYNHEQLLDEYLDLIIDFIEQPACFVNQAITKLATQSHLKVKNYEYC